jgi:hypothetical protein
MVSAHDLESAKVQNEISETEELKVRSRSDIIREINEKLLELKEAGDIKVTLINETGEEMCFSKEFITSGEYKITLLPASKISDTNVFKLSNLDLILNIKK